MSQPQRPRLGSDLRPGGAASAGGGAMSGGAATAAGFPAGSAFPGGAATAAAFPAARPSPAARPPAAGFPAGVAFPGGTAMAAAFPGGAAFPGAAPTAPAVGGAPASRGRQRASPAAATAAAFPGGAGFPIDVDDTDLSMAAWCDESTSIVCEIFADEVLIGNRSNTHLNKAGYQNVIEKFKNKTGILYTRKQFKNKWDRLKIDYGIWKQLTKQTGIGWDESGKNIDMPQEWWKRMAKAIKGSKRFKMRGLQNEDKLSIMFEDLRNTGDDHWCASSGVAPSQRNLSCESSPINIDEEGEAENDDDSEAEEVTPTSSRGKRSRCLVTPWERNLRPLEVIGLLSRWEKLLR